MYHSKRIISCFLILQKYSFSISIGFKEKDYMPIPQLSVEERREALLHTKEARVKRAEIRQKLRDGKMCLSEVLEKKKDPIIGRMKVATLIETLPGYGKTKTMRLMEDLNISASRRIRGLGTRQEAALLEYLA